MFKKFCLVSLFSLLVIHGAWAQEEILKAKIARIITPMKAEVGVSVLGIEDGKVFNVNGGSKFPMQSVFKFPLALAVLSEVDKGRFTLDQEIDIRKSDLLPNTWSPIREKYPEGNIKMSLAEILKYTVSQSDNNGCDILLGLIGGPKALNNYIHSLGIKDFAVQFNEQEMHKDWNAQFSNWATPVAVTKLLKTFYEKKILSRPNSDFLWNVMTETKTGQNRIKGQLPQGIIVAHKTGTSDTNKEGVTAAVNDVGIITFPDGKHVAITVFIANSRENSVTNEKIIAEISRAVWDGFEMQGR